MPRNPAAQTAFGPIVLSAVEQQEPPDRRLVDDDLAASFLPKPLRALVRATRFDPVRRMIIAASEHSGPGLWANLACRKSYIDDNLAESLPDVAAVVILGSGLDTRPLSPGPPQRRSGLRSRPAGQHRAQAGRRGEGLRHRPIVGPAGVGRLRTRRPDGDARLGWIPAATPPPSSSGRASRNT